MKKYTENESIYNEKAKSTTVHKKINDLVYYNSFI